jgi:cysteine-rich repeat protein
MFHRKLFSALPSHSIGILIWIIFCTGLACSSVIAAPQGEQPGKHLTITEVLINADDQTIEIFLQDLEFGPDPIKVSLGGELTFGDISSLCTADTVSIPQSIICDFTMTGLPPDGDYLLTVLTGGGQSQGDEYDLTVGNPAMAGEHCPEGQFITGFDAAGGLMCASPGGSGPACGDGNIDPGEACDDGNTISGDGCDNTCQLESLCGNYIVEPGETCDDGNTVSGDGCDSACQLEDFCGNSIIDLGETCDGSDLGGATCPSLGFLDGVLGCLPGCDAFDSSGCVECNDCRDCGGQACSDGQCGSCSTDSDCCTPLVCDVDSGMCVSAPG